MTSPNYNIGICDDDTQACLALIRKIRDLLPEASLQMYGSGEELLRSHALPDLLFLDVELGGMSGLEVGQKLRERNARTEIVFVSGHPDYVFDAFDVEPAHYLLKPVSTAKLQKVIQLCMRRLESRSEDDPALLISRAGHHTRVRHGDIKWAEVFNRTVTLHTTTGDVSYYGKLGELEKQLGEDFFRTHRAYLVNYRYVDSYDSRFVRVGEDRVPLSKSNRSPFAQGMMQFITRQRCSS